MSSSYFPTSNLQKKIEKLFQILSIVKLYKSIFLILISNLQTSHMCHNEKCTIRDIENLNY